MQRRSAVSLLLLGFLALHAPAAAAPATEAVESPIPAELQAPLLLKVLMFDRNFRAQAGNEIVLGVVVQRRHRSSFESAQDIAAAFRKAAPDNFWRLPLRVVEVELADPSQVAAELKRLQIDVLYVTPLRALAVESVAAATREAGVRSMTAVPEYVDRGLAIGLTINNERPQILINSEAARSEGADLTAQLLRLARIVP